MRVTALLILLASACCAQMSVSQPLIGLVRDSGGHLRRVFGSAGAFLLGPPEYSGVLSVEFNGKTGLVKTDREWLELDREGNLVRSLTAPEDSEGRIPEPEVALPTGTVRLDGAWLVIRRSDGQERRHQLPGPTAEIRRMGTNWLFVAPFAIRISADGAEVFRLPLVEVTR